MYAYKWNSIELQNNKKKKIGFVIEKKDLEGQVGVFCVIKFVTVAIFCCFYGILVRGFEEKYNITH